MAHLISEDRDADVAVHGDEEIDSSGDAAGIVSRIGRCPDYLRSTSVRRLAVPAAVVMLLAIHPGLLAYAATVQRSKAGTSRRQAGDVGVRPFEVYRVYPPLWRFIAAMLLLAVGYEMDCSRFDDGPGRGRCSYSVNAWLMSTIFHVTRLETQLNSNSASIGRILASVG